MDTFNLNNLQNRLIERNTIKCLYVFVSAFKVGGLKKLSRISGMSVGKISKYINYLEQDFKIELISRKKNGINFFSEDAELFYKFAEKFLSHTYIFQEEVSDFFSLEERKKDILIKILTHQIAFREIFPDILSSIIKEKENILFEVNISSDRDFVFNELKNENVDLVFLPLDQELFTSYKLNNEDFEIIEIAPYKLYIYLSKDNELRNLKSEFFDYKAASTINLVGLNDENTVSPSAFRGLKSSNAEDFKYKPRFFTNESNFYSLEGFIGNNLCSISLSKINSMNKDIIVKEILKKFTTEVNWYFIYRKKNKKEDEILLILEFLKKSNYFL